MRRRRPPSSPIERELVSDQDNSDHGVAQIQNTNPDVSQIQNTLPENTVPGGSQIQNTVYGRSQIQNTVEMSQTLNTVPSGSHLQNKVPGLTLTQPRTQEKEPRISDFTNPGFLRHNSPFGEGLREGEDDTVGDAVSDHEEEDKHKEERQKDTTFPDEMKPHFKVTAISFDVAVEHLV